MLAPPTDLSQALYVLWADALPLTEKIREDLRKHFRILADTRFFWSEQMVQSNLRRMYRRPTYADKYNDADRIKGSRPEIHVFYVSSPEMDIVFHRSATGEIEKVHRLFPGKKDLYRTWAANSGGGFPFLVHCAASQPELRLLTVLLFGPGIAEKLWSGETFTETSVHRDLVGAHGWESLESAFDTLSHCVDWCILRGWEKTPEQFPGNDLDLLVSDRAGAASALALSHPRGDRHLRSGFLKIGGTALACDLHWPGDGYLDADWEKNILQNRVRERSAYRPCDEDAFFSLIYGEFVHRSRERSDKVERILHHAQSIPHSGWLTPDLFRERSKVLHLLAKYMSSRGYLYVRPLVQRYPQAPDAIRILSGNPKPRLPWRIDLLWRMARHEVRRLLPPALDSRISTVLQKLKNKSDEAAQSGRA